MNFAEAEKAHPGFRAWARDQFVGNECDSDEYRETQPAKGLGYAADCLDRLAAQGARHDEFARLTAVWLTAKAAGGSYAGADALEPVLTIYFDVLWEAEEHPYFEWGAADEWVSDYLEEVPA